jgi:hypothetical protein
MIDFFFFPLAELGFEPQGFVLNKQALYYFHTPALDD